MKYLIIIAITLLIYESLAQDCMTTKNIFQEVTPVASSVAISTMGWEYNASLSIEFDSVSLYNGWDFMSPLYTHGNAHTNFSTDPYYWNLSGGELTLKLYDIPGLNYDYTAAMLIHANINQHYGYYETRVKLPHNEDLCTSFWGLEGICEEPSYREIDVFEYFTYQLQSNEYYTATGPTQYGGKMYVDTTIMDESQYYIFGVEWFPKSYTLYINNHFVGSFDSEIDCIKEDLLNMRYWYLWIVNWQNQTATGSFPKELKADYIRFYSLDLSNISNDFYDYLSNYDYGVWKTVHLGDTYSSDAKFNDNGKHAIRSTDGFTLGAGFEVTLGTEFETIIYKP
jgi:hypothetical protein